MTEPTLYRTLDALLLVFHAGLVGFNVLGWAWRSTRRLHLITMGATLLFWFGAGVAYGWGYCPLTDWHWDVKRALGETDLPASWIKYHVDALTGRDWNPTLVDAAVMGGGLAALGLSLALNARDRRRSA